MVTATGVRARARELRLEGWSVNDLAVEFGVARSTAWRWVGDLPLDRDTERARHKREHAAAMTKARWAAHRRRRDESDGAIRSAAARTVGSLSDRDLMLAGAVAYWCEGAKAKPWRGLSQLSFCNSDVRLIRLYLAFLGVAGVTEERMSFRVSIHETADVEGAVRWWSAMLGVPTSRFRRSVIKRHAPPDPPAKRWSRLPRLPGRDRQAGEGCLSHDRGRCGCDDVRGGEVGCQYRSRVRVRHPLV